MNDIAELIRKASAISDRQTADDLDSLRIRIGKNDLSMQEWNALILAASHLRIAAWRSDGSPMSV